MVDRNLSMESRAEGATPSRLWLATNRTPVLHGVR